jgi:hypothetical protein
VQPTCATDVDCRISDTSSDSIVGTPPCFDSVEIQGFVEGETFCALTPEPGLFECADIGGVEVGAIDVNGDAVRVCVSGLSSCTEGVCGSAS